MRIWIIEDHPYWWNNIYILQNRIISKIRIKTKTTKHPVLCIEALSAEDRVYTMAPTRWRRSRKINIAFCLYTYITLCTVYIDTRRAGSGTGPRCARVLCLTTSWICRGSGRRRVPCKYLPDNHYPAPLYRVSPIYIYNIMYSRLIPAPPPPTFGLVGENL